MAQNVANFWPKTDHEHVDCDISPRGVLTKFEYGEAPPGGPTPYPFTYHFGRKGTPFIYLLLKKVPLLHTYFRKSL